MQSLELFVPASLQIGSNEPIFGIYRIILTARPCSLEARLFNCIFELLEFVQSLSPKTLHRGQRSFDAKRLQPVKHLTGNRAINPHPAKADATHFGPFAKRPAASIALREGLAAAVRHLELPATAGTAEQARQQCSTPTDRAPSQIAHPVGIVRNQPLIPFELPPRNVSFVVVFDQNLPIAPVPSQAANHSFAASLDCHARTTAPKDIRAGIDRIGEDMMQGVVDGKFPFQRPFTCSRNNRRQDDLFMPHPHEDLPYRLKFGEFGEYKCDRISHSTIRNQFDPIIVGFHVAYCDSQEELPAAGLLLHRLDRALAEDIYFHLAHRAFHPKHQSVVGHARIVDAVFVDNQRAHETTKFQKRMPIAAVARQARGLDREHGANAPLTYRRQQFLETWPRDATAGAAEIVVNHLNIVPSELPRSLD